MHYRGFGKALGFGNLGGKVAFYWENLGHKKLPHGIFYSGHSP
jgi:hypothetical protein